MTFDNSPRQRFDPIGDTAPSSAAERLRKMSTARCLVLPTVWDAMSAVLAQREGASAVATTSGGVSWAHGLPDGEAMSRDEMVSAVRAIVSAVQVPVSADIERGYGDIPQDVADSTEAFADAGVAGLNIEDSLPGGRELRDVDEQCERLAAARRTADSHGVPLVVNARTDAFLLGATPPGQAVEEVAMRSDRYREAGADGLFVPGLVDLAVIEDVVRGAALPVNVMVGPGAPAVTQLEAVGVRRVTLGTALAETAYAAFGRAVGQVLRDGTYGALDAELSFQEYNDLLERASDRR